MNTFNADNLKKLKNLPIFTMSLSSKELFHSNFISWVFETYPEAMGEFFCKLLKIHPVVEITSLEREKQNIDISFYLGNTIVLIENKVKSIAYKEQLDKYSNLYKSEKKCILLSLKKPTFEIEDWQFLDYDVLLQQFKIIINQVSIPYHKYLIEDYIRFMDILSKDFLPLINIENIQISNLYKKNTSENDLLIQLTDLRMHDFFLKGLFEDTVNYLKIQLIKNNQNLKICDGEKLEDCEDKSFYITFGMSRSQGIIDIKYRINDIYIGIQIQGDQYRQFVEGSKTEHIKGISNHILTNNKWFNFSNAINENHVLNIYPKKENIQFNQFKSSNWLFLYRSIKMNSLSNEKIFKMIGDDIEHILNIDVDYLS